MEGYEVKKIIRNDALPFILNIHYAKRVPSISFAYGLFKSGNLVGIVTYGSPASATLRVGIAGKDNIERVLELNRLCLKNNEKNEASLLIGKSLKLLPKGKIIISFADTSQNHVGIVYQATNWIYVGLSAKRTDWVIEGMEHLHGQTIADKYRGVLNRAEAIRKDFGEKFKLVARSRKHRYIYITGSKYKKTALLKAINYKILDYPKKVK